MTQPALLSHGLIFSWNFRQSALRALATSMIPSSSKLPPAWGASSRQRWAAGSTRRNRSASTGGLLLLHQRTQSSEGKCKQPLTTPGEVKKQRHYKVSLPIERWQSSLCAWLAPHSDLYVLHAFSSCLYPVPSTPQLSRKQPRDQQHPIPRKGWNVRLSRVVERWPVGRRQMERRLSDTIRPENCNTRKALPGPELM